MASESYSESKEGRRTKERYVWEVMKSVEEWRAYFQNGVLDEVGNLKKLTLKQAAEKVGIPKKTLEDYHSILRKAAKIMDLERVKDKKMGYLRQKLKEQSCEPAPSQIKEQIEVDEQYKWDNMVIECEDEVIAEWNQMEEYNTYFQDEYCQDGGFCEEEDLYYYQQQYDPEWCINPALPDS